MITLLSCYLSAIVVGDWWRVVLYEDGGMRGWVGGWVVDGGSAFASVC